jgi:hypothetical protein
LELFRQHSQNSREGFEVVVTFNAVLTNQTQTSYSVFYGQDFWACNDSGATPKLKQLKYEIAIIVNWNNRVIHGFLKHLCQILSLFAFYFEDEEIFFINIAYKYC